jgi:hypothetical protein
MGMPDKFICGPEVSLFILLRVLNPLCFLWAVCQAFGEQSGLVKSESRLFSGMFSVYDPCRGGYTESFRLIHRLCGVAVVQILSNTPIWTLNTLRVYPKELV